MKITDILILCSLIITGCEEKINSKYSWKRTYPCSAQIMDFVDASKKQIGREKEKITEYIKNIENIVNQNFQKVSLPTILELLLKDDLVINCGDPRENKFIATWNGVITLNNSYHQKLTKYYFDHKQILTPELELDKDFINTLSADDFEDVYDATYMTYFALADMAETLVHEATHAGFQDYGFPHSHSESTDDIFYEYDPFYKYGQAAKKAIWEKFKEEVGKIPKNLPEIE